MKTMEKDLRGWYGQIGENIKSQGRRVEVCRSFDEAKNLVCEYLGIRGAA